MALPDEFIYQLKLGNPIDSTMGRYVNLIRSGSNYKCLCPFHSEKSPSCVVYTQNQSFYCFGCGAGGDVITFTKRIENLETYEAIKLLAERAGLELPDNQMDRHGAQVKMRTLEINRETANFYYTNLIGGGDKRGLQYLAERQLSPATIRKYGLGFAPAAWDGLLRHLTKLGFSPQELLEAGVCRRGKQDNLFDFFRNRVMFPIVDLRGNVIAFGGRILEDDGGPKYLNSGDTPVFKKSRNLFSLNFAKNAHVKQLILAEGYMDVIAINQAGFENVVATLGTALTAEQARIMAQYATEVIIAYDSDGAGQNATHKAVNLLSAAGIHAKILHMEGAKDPDEYIKKFGATRFKLLLENSGGAINFELARCKDGLDLASEQGKVDFLNRAVRVLAEIQNPLERDVYLAKVAKEEEINMTVLRTQVDAQVRKAHNREKKEAWRAIVSKPLYRDELNPEAPSFRRETKAEETILAYLFRHPDMLEPVSARIKPTQFVTSFHKRLYAMLLERMQLADRFSISLFSDACSDEEMGRITGIEAKNSEIAITEQDVDACIRLLLQTQSTLQMSQDTLSDDDLLAIVENARNTK